MYSSNIYNMVWSLFDLLHILVHTNKTSWHGVKFYLHPLNMHGPPTTIEEIYLQFDKSAILWPVLDRHES